MQQRGQPRPIDRCEPDVLPVELTLQHRELMPQREDLDVLVAVAAGQQSQQRERVGDAQIRQPEQHKAGSSLNHRRHGHAGRRPARPRSKLSAQLASHQHGRINRQAQRREAGRGGCSCSSAKQ
jgi:hypothetical protein